MLRRLWYNYSRKGSPMKRTVPWIILLVFVFVFVCVSVWSQDGEVTYMEGEAEIQRDGEFLDDVNTGTEVENFDQIRTGKDGELILGLFETDAEVHIAPNTTFVIEMNSSEKRKETTVGLITGSIGFNVRRLSGAQDFYVKTETVAMGVRGTNFEVKTSPLGDILVSCPEGSVVCYDPETDETVIAEPGSLVEKRPEEVFRLIPVAVSDIETFKQEWIAERISAFRANALKAVRAYAVRYNALHDKFNEEYAALMTKSAILSKWYSEDRDGITGGTVEMMSEKKEIIGHLFRLRGVLFIFERIYFRLLELYGYFQEGYGRGEIEAGLTSAAFFKRFMAERIDLTKKIGRLRYIIKLYAKRNEGTVPILMR